MIIINIALIDIYICTSLFVPISSADTIIDEDFPVNPGGNSSLRSNYNLISITTLCKIVTNYTLIIDTFFIGAATISPRLHSKLPRKSCASKAYCLPSQS
jgi:hypothetical protein